MTNEETIIQLKGLIAFEKSLPQGDENLADIDAINMAIKVLEQQPCEDAVSRQAVLSYICNDLEFGDEENGCDLKRKIAQEEIYNFVKKMPSVTPKEKTGKWITYNSDVAICSCCDKVNISYGNYCKFCGARMVSE